MKDEYKYDERKMNVDFPFRIKDIVCSTFLYVANKHLLNIIDILEKEGMAKPLSSIINHAKSEIRVWIERTENNFPIYFTPTRNYREIEKDDVYNYDLVKDNWIKKRTIISLLPIYAGIIPKENIGGLIKWINHHHYCGAGNCYVPILPSTDVDESYFAPKNYWRGPIWINTNWMIFYGLRIYGFYKRAEEIRQGIFKLIRKSGFREYYSPFTGNGLGGTRFSWSAALAADLVLNVEIKEEKSFQDDPE